jgi:hypothetical protein
MERAVSRLVDQGVIKRVEVVAEVGSGAQRPAKGIRRVASR